jgi:hypothetical protein
MSKKHGVSREGRRHSLPPHSSNSNRNRASSLNMSTPTRKLLPPKASTATQFSNKPTFINSPQDPRNSPAYLAQQQREKHRKFLQKRNQRSFSVGMLPALDDVCRKLNQNTSNDALFQKTSKPETRLDNAKSSTTDLSPRKDKSPIILTQATAGDAEEPPSTARSEKREKSKKKAKAHSTDSTKTSKKHVDSRDSAEAVRQRKASPRDRDNETATSYSDSNAEPGTVKRHRSKKNAQKNKARKLGSAATKSAHLHGLGNTAGSSSSESEATNHDQEAKVSVVRSHANAVMRSPHQHRDSSIEVEAAEDAGDEASSDEAASETLHITNRATFPQMSLLSIPATPTADPEKEVSSSPLCDSTPTPKPRKRKISSSTPEVNVAPSSKKRKTSLALRGDAAHVDLTVQSGRPRPSPQASSSGISSAESDVSSSEVLLETSGTGSTGSIDDEAEQSEEQSSHELDMEGESAAKISTVASRNQFPGLLAMPGVQSAIEMARNQRHPGGAKHRPAGAATAVIKEVDKLRSKTGNTYSKKVMSAVKALENILPNFDKRIDPKEAPEAWLIEVVEQAKKSVVQLATQRITESGGLSLKLHQHMIRIAKERDEQVEALRDRIFRSEE